MPSIPVTPHAVPSSSAAGGPVVAGVQFKRPTARPESYETVGSDQELANGSTRAYDRGRRRVVSLSWAKMTRDEFDALVEATSSAFVTYAHDAASSSEVMRVSDPPAGTPVAGTYPVRYAVDLTLRARDVTT